MERAYLVVEAFMSRPLRLSCRPKGIVSRKMALNSDQSMAGHTQLPLATVGLWVSVSHDQMRFQPCAMTMGHSERSVLPESTTYMSISPAVGSSVEFISFRAIAVLSRPPAPYT